MRSLRHATCPNCDQGHHYPIELKENKRVIWWQCSNCATDFYWVKDKEWNQETEDD